MPEINQELSKLATNSIEVNFVPHLISIDRGILETIYIKLNQKPKFKTQKLVELYKKFYKQEPFVRIKEDQEVVSIKDVVRTNFCDIAIRIFPKQNLIIIVTAIDNLKKGAAGQAVQNMNIMCGYRESTSLI